MLVKRYQERGYDAFMHENTTKGKKILYKVLIGKFENMEEAAKLANSIKTEEKIDVMIFCE